MASIQHTVNFRLVHPMDSDQERRFLDDARDVLASIPGVQDFRVSAQISPKSDLAFQFSMRFADEAAYAAYDAHPAHVAFVAERWVAEVEAFQEYDYIAR